VNVACRGFSPSCELGGIALLLEVGQGYAIRGPTWRSPRGRDGVAGGYVAAVTTTENTTPSAPAAATEEVRYDVTDHVATITLNAPERMNTISGPMLQALSEYLVRADRDRDVRCIVLTGAGRAFCAGLDLAAQQQTKSGGLGNLGSPTAGAGEFDLRDAPPVVLHNVDTPTIAAINGGAAGYGLDLALGCDIRIAAASAKLNPGFAKRGILPESGGTWLLPRLIGYAKAAEVSFRGNTLTAAEAHELGIVNHAVPDDELRAFTAQVAGEIAANAPLAVRAIKRMMRAAETETFEQNVHHVFLQLLPLLGTNDFREGVAAFMEKRPAKFTGS